MLKLIFKIFTWVFHPLFIISYVLLLMLWIDPFLFGVKQWHDGIKLLLVIFFSSAFIPAFGVVMMKAIGLIKSIQLSDRMDRIGPYIIAGIFYLWLCKNLYSNNNFPDIYTAFVIGTTVTLFLCFTVNVLYKVSVHTAAMGGLFTMVCILIYKYNSIVSMLSLGNISISIYSIGFLVLICAGIVGTSRLGLKAHTPLQVVWGYIIGIFSILSIYTYLG
ncbi:MAG TPA: hypothetical protein VK590_04620 [Saprospiraceae bacterium]|nr:hypothetical protein [Saprospiraceae bacterium]